MPRTRIAVHAAPALIVAALLLAAAAVHASAIRGGGAGGRRLRGVADGTGKCCVLQC